MNSVLIKTLRELPKKLEKPDYFIWDFLDISAQVLWKHCATPSTLLEIIEMSATLYLYSVLLSGAKPTFQIIFEIMYDIVTSEALWSYLSLPIQLRNLCDYYKKQSFFFMNKYQCNHTTKMFFFFSLYKFQKSFQSFRHEGF